MAAVSDAYTRRAAEYIELLGSMDAVHPSDRRLVDTWADTVEGRVLDAGCGPGHLTAYLAGRGLDAHGIDISPSFVEHARSTHPSIRFDLASIDAIPEPDGAFGGLLSWFSTIHHEPSRISAPIAEFARVLRPGGMLLLGFFDGSEVEEFDHAVLPAYRWPAEAIARVVEEAGFEVRETHRRTGAGQRPVGAIIARRG